MNTSDNFHPLRDLASVLGLFLAYLICLLSAMVCSCEEHSPHKHPWCDNLLSFAGERSCEKSRGST